ncbi:hypothetical protein EV421DRAFT_1905185 [Armillaria borealis]|uniref:F-box domain-containing protein n=1 Tax=Armillaria borealis TaxID=47425 RepID=A0AA39MNH6_9AGAR|nr:hypothetical protein EV421DRAFT_1905185 [Armillaria borealis]
MATKLPQELIDKILDGVVEEISEKYGNSLLPDYPSLKALSLTSRHFTPSCQARCYMIVSLIRKSCEQFKDLLSESPHLGTFVRKLRMYDYSVSPIVADILHWLPNLHTLSVDCTCFISIAEHMHTSLHNARVFSFVAARLPNISTLLTVISLLPNVETLKLKSIGLEDISAVPFHLPEHRKIPSPRIVFISVIDKRILSALAHNLIGPNAVARLDKVTKLQINVSGPSFFRWDIQELLALTHPSLEDLTIVMPLDTFPPPIDFSRHSKLRSLLLRMPLPAFATPLSDAQNLTLSLATLPHTTQLVLLSLTQHSSDGRVVQNDRQWQALGSIFGPRKGSCFHIRVERGCIGSTEETSEARNMALGLIRQYMGNVHREGRLIIDGELPRLSPFTILEVDS